MSHRVSSWYCRSRCRKLRQDRLLFCRRNKILDKIIKDLENRLIDHHIKIEITDEARNKFIEEGYDINFGARPLKRLVGKTLEVDLSKLIIEGKLHEYDTVIVDYNDDNFIVKRES